MPDFSHSWMTNEFTHSLATHARPWREAREKQAYSNILHFKAKMERPRSCICTLITAISRIETSVEDHAWISEEYVQQCLCGFCTIESIIR